MALAVHSVFREATHRHGFTHQQLAGSGVGLDFFQRRNYFGFNKYIGFIRATARIRLGELFRSIRQRLQI
jgi:hypothetical protein